MKDHGRLVGIIFCLAATVGLGGPLSAADEPNDEAIQMIVNLLNDKDRDMRTLGLQQVREEAKGAAATNKFASLLPKLPPNVQVELLSALADRGDKAARPAVLDRLNVGETSVKAAALRALGPLGETSDVPLIVRWLATAAPAEQIVARTSLIQMCGQTINPAIVAELKQAKPELRGKLIEVLAARRATDSIPAILANVNDANAEVRKAAMTALGSLAGPEHVADMLQCVLKAKPGSEREDAEKAVMLVCNRTEDPDKRAAPLLAAMAKLDENDKTALLATLGRVGGPDALKVVEAAIADDNPHRRDAGIQAICNWSDASVAARLLELAETAKTSSHRRKALSALARVAVLPDKRSPAERLSLLEKAMSLSTAIDERNYAIKRAKAIRTIETLRFVAPYLAKPEYAQEACATVVELAHYKALREPNKAEFDKALDVVISICKDADLVDRAQRYKKGQTRALPTPSSSGNTSPNLSK